MVVQETVRCVAEHYGGGVHIRLSSRTRLLGVGVLLLELKLQVCTPMPMWMDNQAAVKQLEAEKSTTSAKYVDIRFKFICHYAREGTVVTQYVKSESMMADILTKSLPAPRMEELCEIFNLKAIRLTLRRSVRRYCF